MSEFLLSVPTLLGTESIVANEIRRLGYETTQVVDGRVTFKGDEYAICRTNINLRSAERVMILLSEFKATSFEMLFDGVAQIPWENFIAKTDAFPVNGYSIKSKLYSVPDCQAIIKKSVVKRLGAKYGIEWFDENGAVLPIRFSIMKDNVSVFLDTSGVSLYKRGYREKGVAAPLRETLAYTMIDISRWRGDRPFLDPFCGSGTVAIEAALLATKTAPGLARTFAAQQWESIIATHLWDEARDEAREAIRYDAPTQILASDIDPMAVDIARDNAAKAGVADKIHFEVSDMRDVAPFGEKGVIVCNPPYGERLMDDKECEKLYRDMKAKFAEFPMAKKYILTSNENFERIFGRADKRRKVYNGMLKCCVYQYFR